MLSCLSNENPGSSQAYSSSCRIHKQWERCNKWSSIVWAPTTAAFLQGMPLPLWDGQALLAEEESNTLVNPSFSFSSPCTAFQSALHSPKTPLLLPSLILISLQLLYFTRIHVEYKIEICFTAFFWTFALINESVSRMFESRVASLSPNPQCSQSLKCYIHALMRDKMEIR